MARIRQNFTRRNPAWGGCRNGNTTSLLMGVLVVLVTCLLPTSASARPPLSEAPVLWYATDDQPIEIPEFAEPGLISYAVDSFVARPFSRFWHPGRIIRNIGTGDAAPLASDVNSLDEVVNSTWFTNRIGIRTLSDDELRYGPSLGHPFQDGPDRSEPWVIVGAKTAGVTPGFRIQDARGDIWLLKFDPASHPGLTIRAGVVSNLIFHAIGFNTPTDRLVVFDRKDLAVGEDAKIKLGRGGTQPITEANLDSILTATGSIFEGRFHALASRYLDGVPLGPFDDQGKRADDPNDIINHQNRRELRGLRVFAAWLNHFDTKMHNSLDMYVGEPGQGHVQHYLIDFASTLGAYGDKPVKRFGYEYGVDIWPITGRLLTFGSIEDTWVYLERPAGLEEVGLFDVSTFTPQLWKPDLPNSAMANLTTGDGYWAAKIVSAFTDHSLRVLVEQGRYQDPAAVDFLVKTLAGRRDKIARFWFGKVPPLDYFSLRAEGVVFSDLAVERGYAEIELTTYRSRISVVDHDRSVRDRTEWLSTRETIVPLAPTLINSLPSDEQYRFLAIEVQVNRGDGWSSSTTAFFSLADGHIVGVDR